MSNLKANQRGLTVIGVALSLGLIAFFTLLILKIGPIYLENMKIRESLASLKEDKLLATQSIHRIKSLLLKRFDINMVEVVSKDDIEVYKEGDYVRVGVSYEAVENIWGSLNALAIFDEFIEVGER